MPESSFEHEHEIGNDVFYPDDNRLVKGTVDEVHFLKKEMRGGGQVQYLVVPQGKSKRQGVVRSQDDVMSR